GTASTTNRWLTRGNSIDRQPTFSSDGQWVLFSSNRSGNLDLWKLSTATGAVRRITEDPGDDWDPAFTPDGAQILWSSSRGGHFEIWICAADGSGARKLSDDGADAENPTATKDGQWIVYNSTNRAKSGIWKIHPDGSGAVRVVPGSWSTPDVSQDGAYVAFRTGGPPRVVNVARLSDGVVLPFPIGLPGAASDGRPRWFPDGRTLAYTGTDATGTLGIYAQPFSPQLDTRAIRRAIAGFSRDSATESFAISPDGTRLVYSAVEHIDTLMLAEGLPGIEPPRRRAH
ncbi:MAG TPA: hypothetical protein VFE84_08250, partial [Patescibacteria group bacterium]|nr:hypothetical protein [Patescibacteria group bacterium]